MFCVLWLTASAIEGDDTSTEDEVTRLGKALHEARRQYSDTDIEKIQEELLQLEKDLSDSFDFATSAAESYLFRANFRRTDRTIRKLEKATVKEYRKLQANWGKAGMPYAEKARKLAKTDAQRAHAERLIGELYVHQINGPIAGLINGPKALSHIQAALAFAPGDPECNRAQGLMFLYNPPINGGDVNGAIRTFRRCTKRKPESDEYHLYLSLAFRKKKNLIRAEVAAKKALQLNPDNVDAKNLLDELDKEKESSQ